MKLIDAIKEKGDPFWIPDCGRDELPEFFKELGFKTGVEIGVSWGENITKYCEVGLNIYGVDPWKDDDDHHYRPINYLVTRGLPSTQEDVYKLAVERTSSYPNCTLIRKTSVEALSDFGKRSLDFVYIDGNHAFGYVAMDLMKWSDKIRRGGVIAGHDYYSTKGDRGIRHVRAIVDAFAKSYDFTNWYVLGRKNEERQEGEKFDRELSFMFFKNW